MNDPAIELQTAMRAAIIADAELAALIGSAVFDHVPEGQPLPYVQFGFQTVREWDVTPTEIDAGYGYEVDAILHAWSAYEGSKECATILSALNRLFRSWGGGAALISHALVNIRFVFSDRLRDPDGQAWHGVIQFRAVLQEI